MNNNQINKFVQAHITRTSQTPTTAKPKANKAAAPKRVATGTGPVFPTIAQPQQQIVAPSVGPKAPTGKPKVSTKGQTIHVHIHMPGGNGRKGSK